MADDQGNDGLPSDVGRLLRRVLEQLGYDAKRPDDPLISERWDVSLLGHLSALRDALHALNNKTQVLTGRLEIFERKLDVNADLSVDIAASLDGLKQIARDLGEKSHEIKDLVAEVVPEQPLLIRNLLFVDTNASEIALFAVTAGECAFFAIGSETLIRSALFQAIAQITNVPALWAIATGLLSLGGIVAFVTRRRILREAAAWSYAFYYFVTGILPIFYAGAVLGSLHHCIFALIATWILIRGPARAI